MHAPATPESFSQRSICASFFRPSNSRRRARPCVQARRLRILLLIQAILELFDLFGDCQWIDELRQRWQPYITSATHPAGLASAYTIHYTVVTDHDGTSNLAWDRTQLDRVSGWRCALYSYFPAQLAARRIAAATNNRRGMYRP